MVLQGKGFFTNNLSECEGGDPTTLAAAAKAAGLSHVVLKIAEESRAISLVLHGIDLMPQIVQSFQIAGIAVWGWHHIRGAGPETEAGTALELIQSLGLEGYIINAESDYEQPGCEASARQFMSALCGKTGVPIGLSSYHFPNFHPEFPWSAFLEGCQYHFPKVFWEQAHDAGEQLRESKRQCDALPNARIYIPVGAAYQTTGWAPQPSDLSDFLATAQELGLPAVCFFQWDQCRKFLPKDWETISAFSWPIPNPSPSIPVSMPSAPVEDPFSLDFLARLNSRQPAQVASLYDPAAVRTWMNETVHGIIDIQDAYTTLFKKMPAGIQFDLSQVRVENDVHCLTWKAGLFTGQTTLVVRQGKIVQDYTFVSS